MKIAKENRSPNFRKFKEILQGNPHKNQKSGAQDYQPRIGLRKNSKKKKIKYNATITGLKRQYFYPFLKNGNIFYAFLSSFNLSKATSKIKKNKKISTVILLVFTNFYICTVYKKRNIFHYKCVIVCFIVVELSLFGVLQN